MKVRASDLLISILLLAMAAGGCSSSRPAKFGDGSVAPAGLSQSNFRVLKSNVQGDSYGFRFLGFIPIVPARVADAKADLYQKLERAGVQLEGRSIAVTNATEDDSHYYFLIGSVPRITLTADIIEFVDNRPSSQRSAAPEPANGPLVPSSILKPSALHSPPPSKPMTTPPVPATPTGVISDTPPVSTNGLAPIQMDVPITEFDIPAFGSTKSQNGSGPQ